MKKIIPEKIKAKSFMILDPIFRQRIFVMLNQDEKSIEKFLNKEKGQYKDVKPKDLSLDGFNGISMTLEHRDGWTDYLIVLKEFQWAIFHQATLIHEITHTVFKIFASNNIPFNYDTQEFVAHSIGRIYEMISKKLLVIVKVK